MTPDQLDMARIAEAERRHRNSERVLGETPMMTVAYLARTGWEPPVAVDPDLIEARKLAAAQMDKEWAPGGMGAECLRGEKDDHSTVRLALAAIERGRELQHEQSTPFVGEAGDIIIKPMLGADPGGGMWYARYLCNLIENTPGAQRRTIICGDTKFEYQDGAYFSGPRS